MKVEEAVIKRLRRRLDRDDHHLSYCELNALDNIVRDKIKQDNFVAMLKEHLIFDMRDNEMFIFRKDNNKLLTNFIIKR